jgi:hypothetical protein
MMFDHHPRSARITWRVSQPVSIDVVTPWETPAWDEYVAAHPGSTVFHTSAWCRIVADIGRYRPRCLMRTENGRVTGVLPAMEIRSRLTGNRLGVLPFSDECFPLADGDDDAVALMTSAVRECKEHGLDHVEMRGAPALAAGAGRRGDLAVAAGLTPHAHYNGYLIPLSTDTESVRMTFGRKSVRQMISKSAKLGVTIRRGVNTNDVHECHRLYALNRMQHGIPPQPERLFRSIWEHLRGTPEGIIYLAEFEGVNVASLVTTRFNGVAVAKYEGIDLRYRRVLPIHALLWTSIREAAESGDRTFDLGRTAMDNVGLNEFKSRWGTERVEVPYYYYPETEGLSVVKSDSWKYRLFTSVFRRLPYRANAWLGGRIFRHFG